MQLSPAGLIILYIMLFYLSFIDQSAVAMADDVHDVHENQSRSLRNPQQQISTAPTVYMLDVFTDYYVEAVINTAVDVFRQRFPQYLQRYQFEIVRKDSERNRSERIADQTDSQLALSLVVESLNHDNRTFVYMVGPGGSGEGKIVAMVTPIYNLVSISGTTSGDMLSDIRAYSKHATFCARNIDYGIAQKVFVRLLKFDRIAMVLMDKNSVDRLRIVENMLLSEQTRTVARYLLDREREEDVARAIRDAEPYAIITEFGGLRGAQAICRLFKNGVLAEDTVWIISGPFDRTDWWEPKPSQQGWNCTRDEMLAAINGSLAIEAYAEPLHQNASEVARRVDKLDNTQLRNLMLAARAKYPDAANDEVYIRWYYVYDATIAGLLAFYRAADKFERQYNLTVNKLKDYPSAQFQAWGNLMMAEILNTSFYGATGHVSITADRHSGEATIQVSQFQSVAATAQRNWVLVGKTSTATKKSKVWSERLVFGTATGEPPHVIKARDADSRRQNLILYLCFCAAVILCFVALLVWLLIRRARKAAWRDISWVLSEHRLTYNESSQKSARSLSAASAVSATSSMVSFKSQIDLSRCAVLDGTHQVWIRNVRWSSRAVLTSIAPAKLNKELFPLARVMVSIMHDNVNRFYGFANAVEDREVILNAAFAMQPKGSVRRLLNDKRFVLEQEMKLLLLTDIVLGTVILHDSVGPHGFLNADNLLLDERYTAKITDYGLIDFRPLPSLMPAAANTESVDDDAIMEKLVFRAPELLRWGYYASDLKTLAEHFSAKCDVYSLGLIFVEVMTRQLPFASFFEVDEGKEFTRTSNELLNSITKITSPPTRPSCPAITISALLSDLIKLCWSEDPAYRPSTAQVLRLLKRLPGYKVGNVMQNLVKRLENYAQNLQKVVEERTHALFDEMSKTEQLLLQILPRSVAEELKKGNQVLPETFDSASIYFSDIVGFTTISSESSPMEVVNLLNKLYTTFDFIIARFDVYKVETIGDAYMVASGLPERNDKQHCSEIAHMSLCLLREILTFEIPHRPADRLALRIGLHCGPCVAGVVGLKMPRYCLFGDTVNTASRMESNGVKLKIHTSDQFYRLTTETVPGRFEFEERGKLDIKGKGEMNTYWLISEAKQIDN